MLGFAGRERGDVSARVKEKILGENAAQSSVSSGVMRSWAPIGSWVMIWSSTDSREG
jgi:hypothetical protein